MKLKKLLLALLVIPSLSLVASDGGIISNSNKNEVRYIKNIKRLPDVIYQQELRNTNLWKNFVTTNGTWYVIFNEENGKPHRAFGKPIPVFGMNIQTKAINFITSKLSDFKIPVSELNFTGENKSEGYQYALK
jgi:hypothetical protein